MKKINVEIRLNREFKLEDVQLNLDEFDDVFRVDDYDEQILLSDSFFHDFKLYRKNQEGVVDNNTYVSSFKATINYDKTDEFDIICLLHDSLDNRFGKNTWSILNDTGMTIRF